MIFPGTSALESRTRAPVASIVASDSGGYEQTASTRPERSASSLD